MQKLSAILVDGTVYFSWLFIVSMGLTLIYGVMKILNIAHGSFYALGAYTAATAVGAYFAGNYPATGSFLVLIAAGIVVGAAAGFLVERGLLRPMYGRDEIVLVLVTYAIFLIFEDLIKLVWGVDPYFAYQPYALLGRVSISGIGFAVYDFGLLGLAILLGIVAWWVLNRTRRGKLLLAVIHDREISTAMGINVTRIFTATFVIGAMLGALGGAVDRPGDLGRAGHRRRGDRARLRGQRDRRARQRDRRRDRRAHRRDRPRLRGASHARGRAVRDLRRHGCRSGFPAAGFVRSPGGPENLRWAASPQSRRSGCSLPRSGRRAFSALLGGVPAHRRARQGARGAGLDGDDARRPRLVRPGPFLRARRLCRGTRDEFPRADRRGRACRARRGRLGGHGLRARLRSGEVSRDLLRHAQSRAVHDPLRRAGTLVCPRVHRRIQSADAHLLRHRGGGAIGAASSTLAASGRDGRQPRRLCIASSGRPQASWARRS